jgi:hypothetical protein
VVVKTAVAIGLLAQAKVPVVHHVLHTTQIVQATATAMIAHLAPMTAVVAHHLVVAAMIVTRVQHVVTMNVNLVLLVTAKIVQHVQVLVVASATATVQSVLHTESQIQLDSKTALQSAVGQKIAVAIQVAIHLAKSATQTVRTVQHAMIHANHHSAVHATQTQTRRLSSRTRFLSVLMLLRLQRQSLLTPLLRWVFTLAFLRH